MKISILSESECSLFADNLKKLIEETIDLPDEAKNYYYALWTEKKIRENLNKSVSIYAVNDENKVGGVLLGTSIEGGVGTIIWLLVDKSMQKRGIGAKLFSEALNLYLQNGAHKIKLTVPSEDTIEFYKKQGMFVEGIHKNHWWHHDFWSMGLTIK